MHSLTKTIYPAVRIKVCDIIITVIVIIAKVASESNLWCRLIVICTDIDKIWYAIIFIYRFAIAAASQRMHFIFTAIIVGCGETHSGISYRLACRGTHCSNAY